MDPDVQLTPVKTHIDIEVTCFDGQRRRYHIDPHHALVDEHGYIRQMSFNVDDGSGDMCNVVLLPKNTPKRNIEFLLTELIAPFGLVLLAGKILQGQKVVYNLARFLSTYSGSTLIKDIFRSRPLSDGEYYTT